MQVTRRSALKHLFIISAGTALLPSCVNDRKGAAGTYANLPFTAKDEETLVEVSSTILPTTDTPGAKEVGALAFALRILNDCYKKEDQEKFAKGFSQFQDAVQKKYSKSFMQCSEAERIAALKHASEQKDTGEEYFFKIIKRLTIQAYTSSEYYLTKVDVYKLVPGKFISSVKV